ncbi:MAG TPA: dienelactone hydrolase family protein, partial [Chloroflexota bacterium]
MCHDDDSHPPMPLSENSGAQGKDITLTSSDVTEIAAYLATPGGRPNGQVVILPDARGLHEFYRELALRFADIGMRALAIDYFGRTSPIGQRDESTDFRELIGQMSQDTFRQDLATALDYIRQGEGQDLPTFTVGFCLGGSLAFWSGSQGFDLAG